MDRKDYKKHGEEILKSGIPSLIKHILPFLTVRERDDLWGRSFDMSYILVGDFSFLYSINDTQARDIIGLNNPFISMKVAKYTDWRAFEECFEDEEYEIEIEDDEDDESYVRDFTIRISKVMYHKLFKFIRSSRYPCVRNALISNQDIDPKYLPDLKDCLKLGIDVFNVRIIKTGSDLDLIETCPSKVLVNIADNVHLIQDKKIRKCIVDMIIGHPDPEVRLALAENSMAPKKILEELLHDEEEDVVNRVRESLSYLRDDDDEDDDEEDIDVDEESDSKKKKGLVSQEISSSTSQPPAQIKPSSPVRSRKK
ncbi:MAG: hypothetical protein IJU76_07005 [Desulfovibrionaceae bacterium]|nr:hypothetical protein [Desulfovibrionaceae bacterium]